MFSYRGPHAHIFTFRRGNHKHRPLSSVLVCTIPVLLPILQPPWRPAPSGSVLHSTAPPMVRHHRSTHCSAWQLCLGPHLGVTSRVPARFTACLAANLAPPPPPPNTCPHQKGGETTTTVISCYCCFVWLIWCFLIYGDYVYIYNISLSWKLCNFSTHPLWPPPQLADVWAQHLEADSAPPRRSRSLLLSAEQVIAGGRRKSTCLTFPKSK